MAKPTVTQSRSSNATSSSYTVLWVLSALMVVFFALALAIFPPVFGPIKAAHDPVKWVLFFGRFHPLVVHLPIGVLMLSILLELGCLRSSIEEKWGEAALFSIFIGAGGSVIGVVFGVLLTREGGYQGGAFILHQALGIATAVGAIIALFLRLSAMSAGGRGLMDAYRFFLLATFGVMSIGAHFGGNMVHGSKYLIEYAPESMAKAMTGFEKWLMSLVEKPKPVAETPKAAEAPKTVDKPADNTPAVAPAPTATPAVPTGAGDEKLVFQHLILPILEAKCNKCHNADKTKGDLRMDTYELLMKGGSDGATTVIVGKPDTSLMLQRIALPSDDDEHMPPEGKDQTTKEENGLLKWWVAEGASNTLKVKDAKIPADLQAAADAVLKK